MSECVCVSVCACACRIEEFVILVDARAGYYCPNASSVPTPCPKGTYGNATGLVTRSACTPCDPGKFCDSLGLSLPTGLCIAGYYCISAAQSSTPPNGATGGVCARGGFCPAGSWQSSPCPAGTFNNQTGSRDPSSCYPCTPGYYCVNAMLPAPTGPCSAGYGQPRAVVIRATSVMPSRCVSLVTDANVWCVVFVYVCVYVCVSACVWGLQVLLHRLRHDSAAVCRPIGYLHRSGLQCPHSMRGRHVQFGHQRHQLSADTAWVLHSKPIGYFLHPVSVGLLLCQRHVCPGPLSVGHAGPHC